MVRPLSGVVLNRQGDDEGVDLRHDHVLIIQYLLHLRRRNLAVSTTQLYASRLRGYIAAVRCRTATTARIEEWVDSVKRTPRARYAIISTLSGFHKWMVLEGIREDDPTVNLVRPKMNRHLPRPINTADLSTALELAPVRMKAWLCLAAFAGLRCVEIAGLERADILLDSDPPILHLVVTKGMKERIVPLNPITIEALKAYGLAAKGPVFAREDRAVKNRTRSKLKADTVSGLISQYMTSVGVNATAHQLRHWFGTEVYRNTQDIRLVQELLGHANISTTVGYVALVPSPMASAAVSHLTADAPEPMGEPTIALGA